MGLAWSKRILLPMVLMLVSAGVGACSSPKAASPQFAAWIGSADETASKAAENVERYGAITDDKFPIAAVDTSRLAEHNLRQYVDFATSEHPATIVIDTENRFLYLVQDQGIAIRYGIGVGVAGLEFAGSAIVGYKREWPRWTPTENMIRRNPLRKVERRYGWRAVEPARCPCALSVQRRQRHAVPHSRHVRAPYHRQGGFSRLHSDARHDVIDLHRRVPSGSKVVVLEGMVKTASQRSKTVWQRPWATPKLAG